MQNFIKQNPNDPSTIILSQIFNEEHATSMFQQKLLQKPHFNKMIFKDVGVKIMRDCLDKFEEQNVKQIYLDYSWNRIMVMPKLVCYDKNTWKTLQQLANWSRFWSQLFCNCLSVQKIVIDMTCSFMDGQFVKKFLEGIAKLPNIRSVKVDMSSKMEDVSQILKAFDQAKIFNEFKWSFKLYKQ